MPEREKALTVSCRLEERFVTQLKALGAQTDHKMQRMLPTTQRL